MIKEKYDHKKWKKKTSYAHESFVIHDTDSGVTMRHFWREWAFNMATNAERIKKLPVLNTLYDEGWPDEPCLVVAAGPSAYAEIERIKEAQNAGWKIVAVDRIYRFLRENGVTPDMTFNLDSQDVIAEWFKGIQIDDRDKFALCVTSSPKLYETLSDGAIYPYAVTKTQKDFDNVVMEYFGNKIYSLRTGSIVTFVAVDFALWMGCDPIVTIGNELSWESLKDVPKDKEIRKIKGKYTIHAFAASNAMFFIIDKIHPEVTKLDASGGIMEWNKITLEEALNKYSPKVEGDNEKNPDFNGDVHFDATGLCAGRA